MARQMSTDDTDLDPLPPTVNLPATCMADFHHLEEALQSPDFAIRLVGLNNDDSINIIHQKFNIY